jgi:hypothetical protein
MAQTPNRVGSKLPQLQKWGIHFSPTQGAILEKEYAGVDLAAMTALANTYASTYTYNGQLSFEGAIAKLTLSSTNSQVSVPGGYSFTGARDIVDKWEVGVADETPDLFLNQNWLSMFAATDAAYAAGTGMPNAVSSQIAQAIRRLAGTESATWKGFWETMGESDLLKLDGDEFSTTGGLTTVKLSDIIFSQGLTTGVKYFVDDYFTGKTNYISSAYVLRHTTSAPGDYAANVTDFKVGKLYRISDLLTEANNGALWILPLPGYLNYKILNYEVPAYLPPNYYWGAVKKRASAQTSYRNRIEITQEYIIDAFGRHTYPLAYP